MTTPRFTLTTAAIAASLLLCGTARGVTDEEFNKLKTQAAEDHATLQRLQSSPSEDSLANNNFVIGGGFDAGYNKTEDRNGSYLFGSLNPVLLFRAGDRLLFESSVAFELTNDDTGDSSTETTVEFAQLDYALTDCMILQAGKTILPLGTYVEDDYFAWINKLPSAPLPRSDEHALLPESDLGVQLRGGIPHRGSYWSYAAFAVNGPGHKTTTSGSGDTATTTETLSFDSAENQNHSRGFGGKVGYFVPLADTCSLELGYSEETGKWDSEDDLKWKARVGDARLRLTEAGELRGEYIYTTEEMLTGTIHPKGWWVQAAYSLLGLGSTVPCINKTELVARYSQVDADQGDGAVKQTALGVNYHVASTFVVKTDYEFNIADTAEDARDQFNVQVAYGF